MCGLINIAITFKCRAKLYSSKLSTKIVEIPKTSSAIFPKLIFRCSLDERMYTILGLFRRDKREGYQNRKYH